MECSLAAGAVTLLGLFFWGIIHLSRRELRRKDLEWEALAARRGARYTERGSSFFSWEPATLELAVGQTIVFLDTHVVSHGKSSSTYTRARARFAADGGPKFEVYREHVFASLSKMLGARDLVLGLDAAFDDHFMVKCDDEAATRRVWDLETQRLMLRRLPDARAQSDARVVTLNQLGHIDDAGVLEAMLDVVGRLASSGARGLEDLQALEGARYHPPSGPWESMELPRLTLARRGVEVTVVSRAGHIGSTLRLTARSEHALDPFVLELGEGPLPPDAPPALVDEGAARVELSGARLLGDGRTLTLIVDVDSDLSTLETGCNLLVTLARPPTARGAFR